MMINRGFKWKLALWLDSNQSSTLFTCVQLQLPRYITRWISNTLDLDYLLHVFCFHDVATIFSTIISSYHQFWLKFWIIMTKNSSWKLCRQYHTRFSDITFMCFDKFPLFNVQEIYMSTTTTMLQLMLKMQ